MARHRIFPDRRLIILEYGGFVDLEALVDGYRKMIDDPAFSEHYAGVVDLRQAQVRADSDETEGFAQLVTSEGASRGAWAYLVSEPTNTALTQYYSQVVAERHPTMVCSTVAAAARFLDARLDDLLVETG